MDWFISCNMRSLISPIECRLAVFRSSPYIQGMRRRLLALFWIFCALTLPAGVALESVCRIAMPEDHQMAMTDDRAGHERHGAPGPACCHAFAAQFVGMPSRDDPGSPVPAVTPALYWTSNHLPHGLVIIPALGPPRASA